METEMCFFKIVKNILNKCGLYVYDDSITIFIYLKYWLIMFFLFATFVTSFHYVLLNLDDIQKASTALFAANIMFIGSIYYSMLFEQKIELRSLIGEIESMVKKQIFMRPTSRLRYEIAEETTTSVGIFIVKYCTIALPIYGILLALIPIISLLYTGTAHMIDMYPASVPFNLKTFTGFYCLLIFQLISSAFYLAVYTAALAFHIGLNIFIQAFVNDVETMFDDIDAQNDVNISQIQIKIQLIQTIQLHADVMNFTKTFVMFMSKGLFLEVLTASVTIAIVFVQLETVASNLNVEFYLSINCLWIQSGILFTLSLYADNTTTALLNVSEIAFQSKWFLLPTNLQKHFIPIIDISQKPIHFTCIGICNCTLEVFKKIINSAFSYFLLLRTA